MNLLVSILILAMQLQAAAQSGDKVKLALNWKPECEFGGFYAAQVEGEFSKQNLQVQILEGGSGSPTVQMLATNQVEFAITSAEEIIMAHDRGATKVKALFAIFQTTPLGILTRAERNFSSLKEALQSEGTILWELGLPWVEYVSKLYSPIKVKSAPYKGGVGLFLKDPKVMQQGFIFSEPLLAEAGKVPTKVFNIADTGFNPYTAVLAVNTDYARKNPDIVKRMLKATQNGWRLYLDQPEKTNRRMAELNKAIPFELHQQMAQRQRPLVETAFTKTHGLGVMTTERWQALVDQLLEIKSIKAKPKIQDLFENPTRDEMKPKS